MFGKKSIISLLIIAALILAAPIQPRALAATGVKPAMDRAAGYLLASEKERGKPLTPWSYVALAASGHNLGGTLVEQSCRQQLATATATADYSLLVFTMLAAGEDPFDYQGQNLVQRIQSAQLPGGKFADNIDGSGQGDDGGQLLLNAHVWAILALHAAGSGIPDPAAARRWLSDQQHPDGSFNWCITESLADVDSTGMALMALGALGESKDSPVVQRALAYLKGAQDEDGGFSSWGAANPESCSAVIQGLWAVGIDPAWLKKGSSDPVIAMTGFQLADGSFAHLKGTGASEIATQQGLLALSAVDAGKPFFSRAAETARQLTVKFKVGAADYQEQSGTSSRVVTADAAPFVRDGRVYVPLRYLALSLGIPETGIQWLPPDQKVTLVHNQTTLVLTVGSDKMQVNGVLRPMDVAPVIRDGRTFLPARYVAEAFGCRVAWDQAGQTVIITR